MKSERASFGYPGAREAPEAPRARRGCSSTLLLLLGDERKGSTEAQDIYGTRLRLTQDGLTYGKEFVPFDEMGNMQPAPDTFWNPGTNLFEVTVVRRNGLDLVIKPLPPQTADRLRQAIIDALRER